MPPRRARRDPAGPQGNRRAPVWRGSGERMRQSRSGPSTAPAGVRRTFVPLKGIAARPIPLAWVPGSGLPTCCARSWLTCCPPVAPGRRRTLRIASPSWVHRLEPLRVISASFVHSRYSQPASAAPAAGGIPVANRRDLAWWLGGAPRVASRTAGHHAAEPARRDPDRRRATTTCAAPTHLSRDHPDLTRRRRASLDARPNAAGRDRAWDVFQGRRRRA